MSNTNEPAFQNAPPWETAPEWAEYRSFDASGLWWFYRNKPFLNSSDNEHWSYRADFDMSFAGEDFIEPESTRHLWRESLQQRPQ